MFMNPIKKVLVLNEIDLNYVEGNRLFFSKKKNIISSVFWLTTILIILFLVIFQIHNNALIFLGLLTILMSIYFLIEAIGRVLLKNPILILNNHQLYYLKSNQWYDITKCKFDDQYVSQYNFGLTYCMSDKDDTRIITIKNWYLKNPEDFKNLVNYN